MSRLSETIARMSRRRSNALGIVSLVTRQRRVALTTFGMLAGVTFLAAWLQPLEYEARIKLLLRRDRVDTAVTPARDYQPAAPPVISEQELQSEVHILEARDLLERVATTCGLLEQQPSTGLLAGLLSRLNPTTADPRVRLEAVVSKLELKLRVEVVKKSYVLLTTYKDPNRDRALCVLETLAAGHIEKNLGLKRQALALDFFQREASSHRDALAQAEARLVQFGRDANLTNVELEQELTTRRLTEAEAILRQAEAAIAEATERGGALEAALGSVPSRQVTQVRVADHAQLIDNLKSSLLALELKRMELLGKYAPEYRLVKDVEAQIAETQTAITEAERNPLRDETTDNDPTHEWVRGEIARVTAELIGLRARRTAAARMVRQYQAEARDLTSKAVQHRDLARKVTSAEENYLLYLRRQEEARISDALDRRHLANLVIAEPANAPARPSSARSTVLLCGLLLATIASVLLAYQVEAWNPSLRTPDEAQRALQLPVLAVMRHEPQSGADQPPAGSGGRRRGAGKRSGPPVVDGWTM